MDMETEELTALGDDDICLENMVIVSVKEKVNGEVGAQKGGECSDITSDTVDTERYVQEYMELKDIEGNGSVY
jgi:hypothetical protein